MNKERFHNEIAMRLGYERIMKDKLIRIEMEEGDEPSVVLNVHGYPEDIINATDATCSTEISKEHVLSDEIMIMAVATHQAYIEANKPF